MASTGQINLLSIDRLARQILVDLQSQHHIELRRFLAVAIGGVRKVPRHRAWCGARTALVGQPPFNPFTDRSKPNGIARSP